MGFDFGAAGLALGQLYPGYVSGQQAAEQQAEEEARRRQQAQAAAAQQSLDQLRMQSLRHALDRAPAEDAAKDAQTAATLDLTHARTQGALAALQPKPPKPLVPWYEREGYDTPEAATAAEEAKADRQVRTHARERRYDVAHPMPSTATPKQPAFRPALQAIAEATGGDLFQMHHIINQTPELFALRANRTINDADVEAAAVRAKQRASLYPDVQTGGSPSAAMGGTVPPRYRRFPSEREDTWRARLKHDYGLGDAEIDGLARKLGFIK